MLIIYTKSKMCITKLYKNNAFTNNNMKKQQQSHLMSKFITQKYHAIKDIILKLKPQHVQLIKQNPKQIIMAYNVIFEPIN